MSCPRLPGIVTAVYGHHGQQVKKGEVLAVIESQMLAELRSQYPRCPETVGAGANHLRTGKAVFGKKRSPPSRIIWLRSRLLTEAEIAVDLALVKAAHPWECAPEASSPERRSGPL